MCIVPSPPFMGPRQFREREVHAFKYSRPLMEVKSFYPFFGNQFSFRTRQLPCPSWQIRQLSAVTAKATLRSRSSRKRPLICLWRQPGSHISICVDSSSSFPVQSIDVFPLPDVLDPYAILLCLAISLINAFRTLLFCQL